VEVLIVGAGIGGLTTALALHARDIPCRIVEAAPALAPLGVGINLLPHAMKELTRLELAEPLLGTGIETQALSYYNKHGQEIWREPRGRAAGYPWPQLSIHRGQLQMILLETVRERLGGDAVLTGRAATRVRCDDTAAEVDLEHADGMSSSMPADAVIAADGIHSRIRAQCFPDEGMPLWNGSVLWRGLCETEPFLDGRSMFMAGHQAQKFVCYPVDQPAYLRGSSLTNWIAELRFAVGELPEREDWNRPGDFAEFAPRFESWRFDWFDVAGLIERADVCYEFPMVDRDPLPRWRHGAMTLLGDAAHPMYPIGSNGASQAILDARAIADALADHESVVAAFDAYEASRRPATAAIVKANRGNGPEQVMQLAEERAPDGFQNIDDVIPLEERQAIADRYKQVAGFRREALVDD